MKSVNVPLPNALHGFVEDRTKAGGYESAGEYVRELIQNDQKRILELEQKLLEGLNSGDPIEVDDAYWIRKKAELSERMGKKAARL